MVSAGRGDTFLVPDRAIIPLACAAMAGFIGGLIASVLQLTGGAAVGLGAIIAVFVLVTGPASVVRCRGEDQEKRVVGLLRGGLGVALFAFVYMALLSFLRDGQVLVALLLLLVAGVMALFLAQLDVRDRRSGRRTAPTA